MSAAFPFDSIKEKYYANNPDIDADDMMYDWYNKHADKYQREKYRNLRAGSMGTR